MNIGLKKVIDVTKISFYRSTSDIIKLEELQILVISDEMFDISSDS